MTKPLACGRCGLEVRFGVRPAAHRPPADAERPYWMHQDPADDVDHEVVLGKPWTPSLQAKLDAALEDMAARGKADDAKKRAEKEAEQAEVWDEVPEPEVRAHDIDVASFAPRSGIRQIYNLAQRTPGWEVVSLTASRGPYVGARGQVLSIDDSVVMRMRGNTALDGSTQVAVASWRSGAFDFAYTAILRDRTFHSQPVNSNGLKAFIKGE